MSSHKEANVEKKLRRRVLLVAGVMLCSSTSWGQQRLIANIPFEFRSPAGDMSAGHYEIVAGDGANGNLTRFRNLRFEESSFDAFGLAH